MSRPFSDRVMYVMEGFRYWRAFMVKSWCRRYVNECTLRENCESNVGQLFCKLRPRRLIVTGQNADLQD